jgi:hypothetical protein
MRTITTSKGEAIEVDGDVLAVLEALFKSLWRDGEYTYEHTVQEIAHLVGQLNDEECRQYLSETLFLSYTSYENDRLGKVIKELPASDAEAEPEA